MFQAIIQMLQFSGNLNTGINILVNVLLRSKKKSAVVGNITVNPHETY